MCLCDAEQWCLASLRIDFIVFTVYTVCRKGGVVLWLSEH